MKMPPMQPVEQLGAALAEDQMVQMLAHSNLTKKILSWVKFSGGQLMMIEIIGYVGSITEGLSEWDVSIMTIVYVTSLVNAGLLSSRDMFKYPIKMTPKGHSA